MGVCITIYMAFCFVTAFMRGWYTVTYSPSITVEPCSLPLWDCSLAACKPEDTHTGYHGVGECGKFGAAQVFFVLAAVYAMCYLFFISGILSGEVRKWTGGDFSGCCLTSSESYPPCMPGERHLPHGFLLCGTPFLMFIGLCCIIAQDKTEFEGMDDSFGALFWIAWVMTALGFAICTFNGRAQVLLASTQRLLPPRPVQRNAPGLQGAGITAHMPPSGKLGRVRARPALTDQ